MKTKNNKNNKKLLEFDFSLLRYICLDFSKKTNIYTLAMFILIISLALFKIYIVTKTRYEFNNYSNLLLDNKKLEDTNLNLQIELITLTSRDILLLYARDKSEFINIKRKFEILINNDK